MIDCTCSLLLNYNFCPTIVFLIIINEKEVELSTQIALLTKNKHNAQLCQ
jgi:hypothetical protein